MPPGQQFSQSGQYLRTATPYASHVAKVATPPSQPRPQTSHAPMPATPKGNNFPRAAMPTRCLNVNAMYPQRLLYKSSHAPMAASLLEWTIPLCGHAPKMSKCQSYGHAPRSANLQWPQPQGGYAPRATTPPGCPRPYEGHALMKAMPLG